jgi:O-antigen ligase
MRQGKNLPKDRETGWVIKWLRRAAVAMTALLPLIFIPGIERPFSTPKLYLLGGFVAVAGFLFLLGGPFRCPDIPRKFLPSLIVWAGALVGSAVFGEFLSPRALFLSFFSIGWFLLVMAVRPNPLYLAKAIAISCGVLAVIALLQFSGLDPFRVFGWATPVFGSPRMRVFGTLGNPNFVAAVLVAGLPLCVLLALRLQPRVLTFTTIFLPTAAIIATGSRAAIAALLAALLWVAILRKFRAWRLFAAAVLVVAVILPFLPSRSLADTLDGRLYIWKVAIPHLWERPLFGFGPGAFEPKFIEWETAYWREGRGSADQRRFTGLQDHAHNDYLEVFVDSGFVGAFGFGSLLASFLVFAYHRSKKSTGGLSIAASSGVAALMAVAMVDFPLQRPAELFFFWTLMTIVFLEPAGTSAEV